MSITNRSALFLASVLTLMACGTSGVTLEGEGAEETVSAENSSAAMADMMESATSTSATIPFADRLPSPGIGRGVLELDGYAVPILQRDVDGWVVLSPCGNEVEVANGLERPAAHVVLDPESATAPIARLIERRLAESGVTTVLSRWADISIDALTRARLAETSGAHVFVSLRLVAGDVALTGPAGVEVVHRADHEESRRLGGLIYAGVTAAMDGLESSWPVLDEPGVRPLLNQRGTDFFVVLRESGDAAAVVVDIPGLVSSETIWWLSTSDGQAAIAGAVATAIEQFFGSEASGSGYIDPVELVRDAPLGGSGDECNDPLLPPPSDQ
ncbi:MAG: N-acetylmuramoyl-L-alanine amidase [Acidimicrobiales bacterium]|nr:N-acetylmuramoyl-L-alanine amidase [Acidimicrobiales bacterium]MDG2216479.1 N-acetylmuramoyl-L-alanine amidase [Acidimicrobiales bacterium]